MNQNINIIFYSERCTVSINLLKILQNENLLGYFKLYRVDGRLDTLPQHITTVPTMIVSSINKPLVAKEAFEWINKIKFIRQQNLVDNNKKIIQQNIMMFNNGNRQQDDPLEFVPQEMVGKSDSYAYTKSDEALPHSYVKVGQDTAVIFTTQELGKINTADQKKLLDERINDRDKQAGELFDMMKKQQIGAVMRAEQKKLQNN